MSYCRREGKDKSVFVTKEDVQNTELVNELVMEDSHGIVLPSGDINWDCPCLGDLPQGTCAEEFKAAFSCFYYSKEEEKGMECIPHFRGMQECFEKYPEEYGKYADDEKDENKGGEASGEVSAPSVTPSSSVGEAPLSATPSGGEGGSSSAVVDEGSLSSSSTNSSNAAETNSFEDDMILKDHPQEQRTSHTIIKSENEPQAESHSESKLVSIQVPGTS